MHTMDCRGRDKFGAAETITAVGALAGGLGGLLAGGAAMLHEVKQGKGGGDSTSQTPPPTGKK